MCGKTQSGKFAEIARRNCAFELKFGLILGPNLKPIVSFQAREEPQLLSISTQMSPISASEF